MQRCGGDYFYIVIKKRILKEIKNNPQVFENISHIALKFNIDGVPLYKSTSALMWPIL